MADIKQAARWIQEDKTVERKSAAGKWWASACHPGLFMWCISCADGGEHELDCFDILADDWRIAQ
jgi:hypothetical protein